MNITVKINTLPPLEVRGKLWVLRHDYECNDENFTPFLPRVCELRDGIPTPKLSNGEPYGLPETEKLYISDFVEMTRIFQEFWFACLCAFSPYSTTINKQKWADLTHGAKFATNKRGWNDGYQDYINNVNGGATGMMKENVTTCGNVVLQAGEPCMRGGKEVLPIFTLDFDKSLPSVSDVIKQPWFIHAATVCRYERVDPTYRIDAPYGTFMVNPFPHTGGNHVPVPLITNGGINYIVMRRLRKLGEWESIPSPYVR